MQMNLQFLQFEKPVSWVTNLEHFQDQECSTFHRKRILSLWNNYLKEAITNSTWRHLLWTALCDPLQVPEQRRKSEADTCLKQPSVSNKLNLVKST